MLANILNIFKRFAGNGRAWKLKDDFTRLTVESFLSITKSSRKMLRTIPDQGYPWLCDDETIPYWEDHFGIVPPNGDTIEQRRDTVTTEYLSIGSNAKEYIEYILAYNDFTVTVLENLSGIDVASIVGATNYKIGCGEVYSYPIPGNINAFIYEDPTAPPTNQSEFTKVFFVRGLVSANRIELLKRVLLKYKPLHTIAVYVNTDVDSTFWDAELVVDGLIDSLHVIDAEDVFIPTDPVFCFDAELVT